MIFKNAMQFKAFIKKKSVEKKISAQLVLQNYMLERLLERIAFSKYKQNFIIKGGFLISAIVGLDSRATMDLDATIKGFTLTYEKILAICTEICSIKLQDDISFEIVSINDIRETDDYPGLRVSLKANYPPISVPITVDITTGDVITPREIEYSYALVFGESSINILAYNLETILAEKIETILARNVANTRPRDFYDVYILTKLKADSISNTALLEALQRTVAKRGSKNILENYLEIIESIEESIVLRNFWERYSKQFDYAKNITFDEVCNSLKILLRQVLN